MTLEIILTTLAVVVLNILDSVTTNIGFKQYPDKELKSEANPWMRYLMLKNKFLAEATKQGVGLIIAGACLYHRDLLPAKYCTILLGLVVVNNSSLILSRLIVKRKINSPFLTLVRRIRLPDKSAFFIFIAFAIGLAYLITNLVWV